MLASMCITESTCTHDETHRPPNRIDPGTQYTQPCTDEDDGRGSLPGPLKQVADARSSGATEHLHKLGSVGREKGEAMLPSHGAGEVGLAGPGGALQQDALGWGRSREGVVLCVHGPWLIVKQCTHCKKNQRNKNNTTQKTPQ